MTVNMTTRPRGRAKAILPAGVVGLMVAQNGGIHPGNRLLMAISASERVILAAGLEIRCRPGGVSGLCGRRFRGGANQTGQQVSMLCFRQLNGLRRWWLCRWRCC